MHAGTCNQTIGMKWKHEQTNVFTLWRMAGFHFRSMTGQRNDDVYDYDDALGSVIIECTYKLNYHLILILPPSPVMRCSFIIKFIIIFNLLIYYSSSWRDFIIIVIIITMEDCAAAYMTILKYNECTPSDSQRLHSITLPNEMRKKPKFQML